MPLVEQRTLSLRTPAYFVHCAATIDPQIYPIACSTAPHILYTPVPLYPPLKPEQRGSRTGACELASSERNIRFPVPGLCPTRLAQKMCRADLFVVALMKADQSPTSLLGSTRSRACRRTRGLTCTDLRPPDIEIYYRARGRMVRDDFLGRCACLYLPRGLVIVELVIVSACFVVMATTWRCGVTHVGVMWDARRSFSRYH